MADMKISADFEKIYSIASQMGEEDGKAINTEMCKVYNTINEMGQNQSWTGSRFNDLATAVNNMTGGLTQLLQVIVKEVPESLTQVASNYHNADIQDGNKVAMEFPLEALPEIAVTPALPLNFTRSAVETARGNIETSFTNVTNSMQAIRTKMDQIAAIWNSPAADSYKQKFASIETQINDTMNNLLKQFNASLEQTIEDLTNADIYSDVNQ